MNHCTLLVFSFKLSLFFIGCGAAQPQESAPVDPPMNEAKTLPVDAASATSEVEAPPKEGTIKRSDLNQVLDSGPAALLAEVFIDPVLDDGRFVGFRITQFVSDSPTTIDLRVGDVIVSVNGKTVERPENYFEIFQELKTAKSLSFELLRDGEEFNLLYPIIE